jgi:putative hydrolase of the HAD superfamily
MDQRLRRSWEGRLGLAEGGLAEVVFDGPISRQATFGLASSEDVWRWVFATLGLSPAEGERLRADFWAEDRLDEDLIAYIRGLRRTLRVGMISNAWSDARHKLETLFRIADDFDPLILSAEVGLAKPDPAIFELALRRAGVDASQAAFVDDFEENVAAAAALGMHAVHFRSSAQAQAEISRRLAQG